MSYVAMLVVVVIAVVDTSYPLQHCIASPSHTFGHPHVQIAGLLLPLLSCTATASTELPPASLHTHQHSTAALRFKFNTQQVLSQICKFRV